MGRSGVLGRLCAALILLTVAGPAFAGSAVKEVRSFNKIKVVFTKNAPNCDFKSTEAFERYLRKSLAKVGVQQNGGSIVEIRLEVGGIPFGMLDAQCAVEANLDFRTSLQASNIVTDNKEVRRALDQLQVFPISLYTVGAFGIDTTLYTFADGRNITKAEKKVLDMIDRLVSRFDEARRQ